MDQVHTSASSNCIVVKQNQPAARGRVRAQSVLCSPSPSVSHVVGKAEVSSGLSQDGGEGRVWELLQRPVMEKGHTRIERSPLSPTQSGRQSWAKKARTGPGAAEK